MASDDSLNAFCLNSWIRKFVCFHIQLNIVLDILAVQYD